MSPARQQTLEALERLATAIMACRLADAPVRERAAQLLMKIRTERGRSSDPEAVRALRQTFDEVFGS